MRGPGRAKIERVTGAWRRAKAGSFDARLDVTGIPCVQHSLLAPLQVIPPLFRCSARGGIPAVRWAYQPAAAEGGSGVCSRRGRRVARCVGTRELGGEGEALRTLVSPGPAEMTIDE